jgi:hypothetical protein
VNASEEQEDDEEPEYEYLPSVSRTFWAKIERSGNLSLKRRENMVIQRSNHWLINCWNGEENRIFAIGGQGKTSVYDSVETFDFNEQKWVLRSQMQAPRTSFTATCIDDFIYVFGGFKDLLFYFPEPIFERYSITSDQWEALDLADAQISSLWGSSIARTNDKNILIFGGIKSQIVNSDDLWQTLHRYNPEDGSVEQLDSQGILVAMPKFFTTNGVEFKSIGGVNAFRILAFNNEANSWRAHENEQDIMNCIDKFNEYTKNYQTHIFHLFSYSSMITHNFY